MNNADNNNNNQKLDGLTIFILILAAFSLIIIIFEISDIRDEMRKEEAERKAWHYEHIQKGADEYDRNHPNGPIKYNSIKSNSNSTSNSIDSKKSTSTTSSTYKSTTTYKKSVTTEARTVDPDDHDIDAYYEDYKDEFEDEDDAWDDFEDNEEYWDDY